MKTAAGRRLRFLPSHAHVACRRAHSVPALRADRMLKTLRHARLDQSHETEIRKLLAVDLLILDYDETSVMWSDRAAPS